MAEFPPDHGERMERARLSLDGLSVGDAFGARYFGPPEVVRPLIAQRKLPDVPWTYTDDTEMALSVLEALGRCGRMDQDALAAAFARRYRADPARGYGAGARLILEELNRGVPWWIAAPAAFRGMGSMGNGAAMRVAPLGGYFAADLDAVVEQATASAEVTHTHPEGQAGAVAVAVAAAWAARLGQRRPPRPGGELLEAAYERTPAGETRAGLRRALGLPRGTAVDLAVSTLGTGSRVTAPDTVPFAIWCAARHIDDYVEAMWATVAGLGDCDTTCAIVGGIVAPAVGRTGIPGGWLAAREPLRDQP